METSYRPSAVRKTVGSAIQLIQRRAIIFGVLLISIVMGLSSPYFFTINNLLNITIASSINGIMACGMAMVIISGGIDLSVGALLAFGGSISVGLSGAALTSAARLIVLPWPLAMLGGIVATAVLGLFSGIIITRFVIPPFIVTLGMMSIARGLTYIYGDAVVQKVTGTPMTFFHPVFGFLGGGYIFGIPMPTIVFIFICLLAWFILSYTSFGRNIYAIGGNEETARLAGINTFLTKLATYVVIGALSGVAGIVLTARLSSASPLTGTGYELDVISAVVIGGVSLAGGEGSILGVVAGVLIIGVLGNGLNLLNVPSFYQYIIKGWILITAVALDQYYKRKAL